MFQKFYSNIKYIYFDFDDVLASRRVNRSEILAKTFQLNDSKHLRDFYVEGYKFIPDLLDLYNSVRTQDDEVTFYYSVFRHYLNKNNKAIDQEIIKKAAANFVFTPFEVLPGVNNKLTELKKLYQLGILSNGLPSRSQDIIECDLEKFFRNIIISYQFDIEKPNQEIYELASRLANLKPVDIAFIDDEKKNVTGASNAGFGQAILFTDSFWR